MNKEKALIPNAQIEEMFFRIATDEQVGTYIRLAENGRINLATAYASQRVHKWFFKAIDLVEKLNISVETLKEAK